MFKKKICERLSIMTDASGGAQKVWLPPIPEALQARSGGVIVTVHGVDTDTRIRFPWATGSDPNAGADSSSWTTESSYFLDSGDSTGITAGTRRTTTAIDLTNADILAMAVEILKITAGSGQKKAIVSAWVILKPF
jgi:hypothetical protein